MEPPEEKIREVNPVFRALSVIGLVLSVGLLCTISLIAAANFSQIDMIMVLVFIALVPIIGLFLVVVAFTNKGKAESQYWSERAPKVFNYDSRDVDKAVAKFKQPIMYGDWTVRDIRAMRIDAAKQHHPDKAEPYMRPFNDEVLSFINGFLNELESDLRKEGHIDWSKYENA